MYELAKLLNYRALNYASSTVIESIQVIFQSNICYRKYLIRVAKKERNSYITHRLYFHMINPSEKAMRLFFSIRGRGRVPNHAGNMARIMKHRSNLRLDALPNTPRPSGIVRESNPGCLINKPEH